MTSMAAHAVKEFMECSETDWSLKMLVGGTFADVTLKANAGSVKAHRCVLASVSPVFNAMFNNEMREQVTYLVEVPDITIEVVNLFLYLLYSRFASEVNESVLNEQCLGLLKVCQKYQVTLLLPVCTTAMPRILTDQIVGITMLRQADIVKVMLTRHGRVHLISVPTTYLTTSPESLKLTASFEQPRSLLIV